jgi:hypothetical protein
LNPKQHARMNRKTFSKSFSKTFSRGVSFDMSEWCKSYLNYREKSHIFTSKTGHEPPDSDPRLSFRPFVYRGLMEFGGQSFTGIFT